MMNDESQNQKFYGMIVQALPNTMFKVELEDGREVLTTLKGSVRRSPGRIMPGDRVKVELTPYDEGKGRIIVKYRK